MSSVPESSSSQPRYDPCDPDADPFRPPSIPTLVWCLHCGEAYDSWKMHYEVGPGHDGISFGKWMCGIEGCDGAGFGFDIFPVDQDYVDPDGRSMGQWVEDPPPDPETDYGRPPKDPTQVRCEKCGKTYSSAEMVWWVDDHGDPEAFVDRGWCCPTKGCSGMEFGIDIRPTDPDYVDPDGRHIWKPGEKPSPLDPDEDIPF